MNFVYEKCEVIYKWCVPRCTLLLQFSFSIQCDDYEEVEYKVLKLDLILIFSDPVERVKIKINEKTHSLFYLILWPKTRIYSVNLISALKLE